MVVEAGQLGSRSCLLCWHPAHAHRMKDRLLGSPFPEERVGCGCGGALWQLGKEGPSCPSCRQLKVLLLAISFLLFEQTWEQGMGSREESLGLPLAAEEKPGAGAASTFPAWPVVLSALHASPAPSPLGIGARLVCQHRPIRCCFDVILRLSPTSAGLAGKTTDKWQICMAGAEGGGALPSSGTLTDRCCSLSCCCWAQRPASLLHALNTFLLESQQDFYFPVGHFPAASAPASPARAGCVALSQCVDQHPHQAQAALLQCGVSGQMPQRSFLPLEAPQHLPVSCCHSGSPHGTPQSGRQSCSAITGGHTGGR